MKATRISISVEKKFKEIEQFILDNYKSEFTAINKLIELRTFVKSIGQIGLNTRCRYNDYGWYEKGYSCIPYKGWIFAYNASSTIVVIRGLEHSKNLKDVVY